MRDQLSYIATMDIRLSTSVSPPRVLLSPSLLPSLLSLPALQPPTPPTSMPLPPEAMYSSKEELYTSIQTWAAQHHYAFCIGRSKKINNRTKITYNCDRCGPPPPKNHPHNHPQSCKRQTTTRKTGC